MKICNHDEVEDAYGCTKQKSLLEERFSATLEATAD